MPENRASRTSKYLSTLNTFIACDDDGRWYATALANILRQRRIDAWLSSERLSWAEVMRDLTNADVFIFIGSPRALRSRWSDSSAEVATSRNLPIIPIYFDQISTADEIPPPLRDREFLIEEHSGLNAGPSYQIVHALVDALRALDRVGEKPTREQRARARTPSRPLNEGKLILVGRGEVGKTSLVRRLVMDDFSGDESKTQGINITTWRMAIRDEWFRLNVWDFGGQEIMHATHQFFLTERSLYLLVLNGREGGEDVDAEYWLKQIESFGGTSPVIIVQNKIGQHPFDLNYRGLRARYPQICAFVKTDCRDLIGIADLKAAIMNATDTMPEVRMSFPSDWFAVKERLEVMTREFMSLPEFSELCEAEGVKNDADRDTLATVLHCLGIALNYRDDSRLRDTSVLKPEWVTEGIYQILNARRLAERRGELYLHELREILPRDRYPVGKQLFLVELMRKFSLCFAFPDEADRYLVPELLGKEEPEVTAEFSPAECLNFEYHYGVLPEGLIPRFIVRSHTLSREQPRWHSGVILAHEDSKALVTAVPAERRIVIRVKYGDSGSRRRLLALVRYDFDRINAEFKDRLDAQPRVPLPQNPSLAVDYKKLVTFERKGVTTFPEYVGHDVVVLDVSQLLNGVDLHDQRQTSFASLADSKAVFLSYSHKDETLRDELETHLKLLQRQGLISTWHDRKILPGQEWDYEIDARLERAKIILLLLSADFIASEYCWGTEVKRAMLKHHNGDATVIPIMLRMCDWKGTPFEKLQGLPTDMRPVTVFPDRDSAWASVARGIRQVAEAR